MERNTSTSSANSGENDSLQQCPICSKEYHNKTINKHVNDCLNGLEDKPGRKETRKRKSDSAWGFLQCQTRVESQGNLSKKSKFELKSPSAKTKSKVQPKNSKQAHSWDNSDEKRTHTEGKNETSFEPKTDINVDFNEKKNGPEQVIVNIDDDVTKEESPHVLEQKTHRPSYCNNSTNGNDVKNSKKVFSSKPGLSSNENGGTNTKKHSLFSQRHPQTVPVFGASESLGTKKVDFAPLAERMRPKTLDDYVGQDKSVGRKSILRSLLQSDSIPSMVLWGPPGCGKTTLARIIANTCKEKGSIKFVQLSATAAGVNDVKEVVKVAKNDQRMLKRKTILFLDEIHRFNKTQQDSLLPHIEDGTITLIGATTENPSFQVNAALLSRCRVIVLEKLEPDSVEKILIRALDDLGASLYEDEDAVPKDSQPDKPVVFVERNAITTLANLCDGDARIALNSLQMAVQSRLSRRQGKSDSSGENLDSSSDSEIPEKEKSVDKGVILIIRTKHIEEGLKRSHVLYDRTGEEHYNIISALHKSIRGSDATAALYWLARMMEGGENPLYVARRLVRIASEDIGLADPLALSQAVSTHQACHFIGIPECDVILAQCVTYLARAPKSVEVYDAYNKAKTCVKEHQGPLPSVPLHLRNASTKLMKSLGYGKGYKYNPSFTGHVDQEYLPKGLSKINFFE